MGEVMTRKTFRLPSTYPYRGVRQTYVVLLLFEVHQAPSGIFEKKFSTEKGIRTLH